jgi:hypothetical protein
VSDLPARIVAIATRALHRDRREWAMAMSAELAQVQAPSARWKFALGCARAALVAPQLPSGDGRSRVATVTFLLGVAGCIATTFVVLRTWPHAAGDISRGLAVWFAGSLIVYLWIALRPPRALIAHRDAVRRGVALGFALFFVTAVGKSVIDRVVPPSNSDGILGIFLMVTVVGSLVTTGFAVARTERSFGAGVAATAWIGLVCSILAFNADLLEMLSGVSLDLHMRHSMGDYYGALTPDAFMRKHIGGHLASTMEGLRTLPLLAVIFGSIGAAVGRNRSQPSPRVIQENLRDTREKTEST